MGGGKGWQKRPPIILGSQNFGCVWAHPRGDNRGWLDKPKGSGRRLSKNGPRLGGTPGGDLNKTSVSLPFKSVFPTLGKKKTKPVGPSTATVNPGSKPGDFTADKWAFVKTVGGGENKIRHSFFEYCDPGTKNLGKAPSFLKTQAGGEVPGAGRGPILPTPLGQSTHRVEQSSIIIKGGDTPKIFSRVPSLPRTPP